MRSYAHLTEFLAEEERPDRAPHMPLLGLLSGLSFALAMWGVIGWLALVALR